MSASDGRENLWLYTTYFLQGVVTGIGNVFVVLSIGRYEALRSRNTFLIIIALAIADIFNLLGYLTAGMLVKSKYLQFSQTYRIFHVVGSYRGYIVLSNQFNIPKSAVQCMLKPHCLFWSFSEHLSTLMFVVVSLDRFLAVSFPLEYIGWSRYYAYGMIGAVYGTSLSAGSYGVGKVLIDGPKSNATLHALCWSTAPLAEVHNSLFMFYIEKLPEFAAVVSIIMYLLVLIEYKRKNVQVAGLGQHQVKDQLKQQRKLTKSLGISCFCTLLLYVMPHRLGYIFLNKQWNTLAMICWIMSNFNSAANVIIYFTRHWEIRRAFTAMITCKTMPSELRLWKVNAEASKQIVVKPINIGHSVDDNNG